jgi:formamidopyrimidine-DNA glycosylase
VWQDHPVPELPDIEAYTAALNQRIAGNTIVAIRIRSPFFVRSVVPPIESARGRRVIQVSRLGKRIIFELDRDIRLVFHLMIAGRLHWKPPLAKIGGRAALAGFDFETGTLTVTEAGTKKRASLHLIEGRDALAAFDRGGLEVLDASLEDFGGALRSENHTLKRALTDPRLFSGIGNAYSDEILHRARLSPTARSQNLSDADTERLFDATQRLLHEWMDKLVKDAARDFPEHVTAFREGFAVHGRFGRPCPDCGSPVQRIVYAENESNYCAVCQTGGKLLADRALSRLLHGDWPKTLAELEERRTETRAELRRD